ncbi:MAG: nicotinic acid mononucleotide adenylyltransferase, partial [Planctomycetota bacterium]|nr:nicotinic acid mononucleotide adenylyltransferase [Planctomycetota bacterium]
VRRTEPSYTILTIEHFAQTVGPDATLFLVLGEDNLPLLHTWHRIADIVALATLAILPRPGPKAYHLGPLCEAIGEETVRRILASRVPAPLLDISGTDIRQKVRDGQPIAGLVPATVADYIARHGLYRA